jgi:putative spermidine/putrescine transport system permease protein
VILMLAPVLAVIGGLFMGGLGLALLQSFGYLPLIGRSELSLAAYRHILGQEAFYRSLWLTGWIALTSTALSTILSRSKFGLAVCTLVRFLGVKTPTTSNNLDPLILAILCALMLRRIARGQRWLSFLFQLNIPIPHLVGAIGVLFLFSQSGWLARLAYLAKL